MSEQNSMLSGQQQLIFDNMSDAVLLLDKNNNAIYYNKAAQNIMDFPEIDFNEENAYIELEITKKNKAFEHFIKEATKGKKNKSEAFIDYYNHTGQKALKLRADKIYQKGKHVGTLILGDDITAESNLKRFEKDSARTFTGIVITICIYLFIWSLLEFTLGIHLKKTTYTVMIEVIAFLLFLEVLFFTSLTLKDVGFFVSPKKLIKSMAQVVPAGAITCGILVLINVVLRISGHPVKSYFIGGSIAGALSYISVAILQEFLSRGVIQTSIAILVKVKWQKFFNVLLSSLLFTLMHLPFGFPFMMGAFVLGIALGVIFEKQKNIWGCVLLHWACGYLAMAMFF